MAKTKTSFVKGRKKTGGRKKGTPNKTLEELLMESIRKRA
jgi:hypothetical protein